MQFIVDLANEHLECLLVSVPWPYFHAGKEYFCERFYDLPIIIDSKNHLPQQCYI